MITKFSFPVVNLSLLKALYFYPDVLDYKLNRADYNSLWQRLSQNHGGYLAVYAGQLKRVSWLSSWAGWVSVMLASLQKSKWLLKN